MASFLPRKDQELLAWATHFIPVVQPVVATYGLVAADITAFQTLTTAYSTSLAGCSPTVRNQAAVLGKNQARANLRKRASELSDRIQGTPTVTDEMKSEAGLNVRS